MKIRFRNILYLFTLVLGFNVASCTPEWVDPFNVDFVAEKRPQDTDSFTYNLNNAGKALDKVCTTPSTDAMLYYKRTINLLLASVVLDEITGTYKGRLVIDLPIEDFKVLKEFGGADLNEPLMLQKINEILTNTLQMTFVDKLELAFMNWTDIWYNLLMSKNAAFMVIVMSVLFVVYRLFNAKFSKTEIIAYVAILCYIFDFCITWKRMLQEIEINQYADTKQYHETPVDCFPQNMNGWQVFISYFKTTTDCRQYYKTIMYDVVWDVGPLDVFAHQSRVLIQIFGNVGIAISQMTSGLIGNFPFPLNIIILPLLLIFTLLFFCIIFTYCTNTHISINVMHLLQFSLKKTPSVKFREEIQEITPCEKLPLKTKEKSPKKQSVNEESIKEKVAKSHKKQISDSIDKTGENGKICEDTKSEETENHANSSSVELIVSDNQ